MLRRQARERKEYLYRKAQQLKEEAKIEKRHQLAQALATGKNLSKDIADDQQLQKDFLYDETIQKENEEVDDEYARLSGFVEPKVVITTSRSPSARLSQFTKEMRLMIPNSIRINRGNYIMPALVESCKRSGITDIVVIHEHRGVPSTLTVSHLPYGPTAVFTLHNVVLRHDIYNVGNISEAYPHLIFENFTTKLGQRIKHIPPGVKKESPRVISFVNKNDFVSVRQHLYVRTKDDVELREVGPRLEMRPFSIKLGTLDDEDADVEWMLRRFVRTASRKNYLSE
ncbi:snoRNA-binding rRNA-processing protein imp4 [Brettanomyces bruxellensis]|uniref:U3 small nucleolar ribonucleoprotein protein IMP4 n=1 Tax=Dekkera bruxellensis TaxID=5007 RepID=A0A871R5Y3_DEKBR|nr:snoRNA-binding rRNA-processing protein imp4 [Brettanomyces bruxellensis]QOU21933.1 snoRNA-binding rRNA-processing protein imp4 [Brettanomyces bruxellensis]